MNVFYKQPKNSKTEIDRKLNNLLNNRLASKKRCSNNFPSPTLMLRLTADKGSPARRIQCLKMLPVFALWHYQ